MVFFALLFGIALVPIEVKALSREIGWMAYSLLLIKDIFLIDFPMSMLAAMLFSIVDKKPQVEDGIICGVLYLSILIPLIFIIGTITKMLPTEAIIALQQNLGPVFIAWGVMYLLLDYGLCILGGILGIIVVRELRGNKIQL